MCWISRSCQLVAAAAAVEVTAAAVVISAAAVVISAAAVDAAKGELPACSVVLAAGQGARHGQHDAAKSMQQGQPAANHFHSNQSVF